MPSTQPFTYTALDRSTPHIRLIAILPGHSPQISCKFHIHQLGADAACPPFTALSYTWGPPDPTSEVLITIDNQSSPVRKNLWCALSSYRKKTNEGTFRGLVWIDALCINQQDILERNYQVNKMKVIYSQADTVLIWLGPEENDSSRLLRFIMTMPPLTYSPDQGPPSKYARFPFPSEPTIKLLMPRPDFTIDDLFQELFDQTLGQAFSAMFQRAYWKRLWIVQEVLLAKKLLILCGDQLCEWSSIVSIFSELEYLGQILGQDGLPIDKSSRDQTPVLQLKRLQAQVMSSRARVILEKGTDSNHSQESGERWELHELIKMWFHQECEDPRDRIYGLLGLAQCEISADYDKTLEDIFVDVLASEAPKLSDADFTLFAANLTNALYLNPSLEKIKELGLITGLDLEYALSFLQDFIVLPPWPSEQDHTAEDDG